MKEYYRHLMINPAYCWSMGTSFENKYYFDCYCPFGARSMPAVFQRLSDAVRVIMLRRTSVDGLLGMLDDFLGITYRREGESDGELLRRGEEAAHEFDAELLKMGISKQSKKDSPTAFKIEWLGVEFDTTLNKICIPAGKMTNTTAFFHKEILDEGSGFKKELHTHILEELIGVLCHYSQCWPLGKTLLWPLYSLLSEYRGTWEGKPKLLKAQVTLNEDCKRSLSEWYDQITVVGLEKIFYTCKGRNRITGIELWTSRRGKGRKKKKGLKRKAKLRLLSPWGEMTRFVDYGEDGELVPRRNMSLVVAAGIDLLLQFLTQHIQRCGDIVEVKSNIARL